MNQPYPPAMLQPVPPRKRTVRIVVLVIGVVLVPIVVISIMGGSMFSRVKEAVEFHFKSNTDKFQVTVVEMKVEPNYFMERVHVRCERDMEASLSVADIGAVGFIEMHSPEGKTYYRERHPDKIRDSARARADGGFSSCDIEFKVSTTPTSTKWHSRMSTSTTSFFGHSENSDGVDTTLPVSLTISAVETNWPGSYERGSSIPLANLGVYRILLSIK